MIDLLRDLYRTIILRSPMPLEDAISAFNAPYSSGERGAVIHRLTPATASRVAGAVRDASSVIKAAASLGSGESLAYLCAVMGQESRFDPTAENLNLSPEQRQGLLDKRYILPRDVNIFLASQFFQQGDHGLAMLKGRYVLKHPDLSGLAPVDMLRRFLYDPGWAAREMASRYAVLLGHAASLYPREDPRWVATGCYKAGVRGFAEGYKDRTGPGWQATDRHIRKVQSHYAWFTQVLEGGG